MNTYSGVPNVYPQNPNPGASVPATNPGTVPPSAGIDAITLLNVAALAGAAYALATGHTKTAVALVLAPFLLAGAFTAAVASSNTPPP